MLAAPGSRFVDTMSPQSAPVSTHLRRAHPKGGARDTRMVGDNIVARSPGSPLWSRWRPNPVHQSSRILGQVFTGNHVYLECRGAEISGKAFQKYCWKMLSNARVCLSCTPHSGYISSPPVARLVFTLLESGRGVGSFGQMITFPPRLPLSQDY